mgnify:CR=1 FL=1
MVFMTMILAWNMLSLKGMVREDSSGWDSCGFFVDFGSSFLMGDLIWIASFLMNLIPRVHDAVGLVQLFMATSLRLKLSFLLAPEFRAKNELRFDFEIDARVRSQLCTAVRWCSGLCC